MTKLSEAHSAVHHAKKEGKKKGHKDSEQGDWEDVEEEAPESETVFDLASLKKLVDTMAAQQGMPTVNTGAPVSFSYSYSLSFFLFSFFPSCPIT
jgi:hypothetical protein